MSIGEGSSASYQRTGLQRGYQSFPCTHVVSLSVGRQLSDLSPVINEYPPLPSHMASSIVRLSLGRQFVSLSPVVKRTNTF